MFIFVSLITFSAQDNINDLFSNTKNYSNNFGYLGALLSSTIFSYVGFAAYYLVLSSFYFGMILFFSSSSKDLSERLNFLNSILYSCISIFPLTLFFISFINADNTELGILEISSGGLAGNNLFIILNTYATALVIGLISACTFLILQYFIFYDFINAIYSFFLQTKNLFQKTKIKPKNIVKEVDKTLIDEPKKIGEEKVTTPVTPKPEITVQEDFIDLLDKNIDDSTDVTKDYLENLAENLVNKLEEFGIEGRVEDSLPSLVITRFEINLAPGTKAAKYQI